MNLKQEFSPLLAKNTLKYLNDKTKSIYCYEEIASTNTALKQMAQKCAKEGTVIMTDFQTNGRGRLGRQFFSPKGCGVYFSLLLKPKINLQDATFITVAAAVAVRRALSHLLNIDTKIKWVNDIYVNDKKLCGILTEGATEPGSNTLSYAVLGIGINLTTPDGGYPEEFAHRTTNLSEVTDKFPEDFKNKLIAEVFNQFEPLYQNLLKKEYMEEYKTHSCILGKEIQVLSGPHAGIAVAKDIDNDANLVIEKADGTLIPLGSGDVSIRL